MSILLVPEQVNFRISTTDLEVNYTESGGVTVRMDVQTREDVAQSSYSAAELHFSTVAEVRCITLNFFELYGDKAVIKGTDEEDTFAFWETNGYAPDPGFYQVADSPVLREKASLFDPRNRLDLKHYLLIGYDSHVEIIASSYQHAHLATQTTTIMNDAPAN